MIPPRLAALSLSDGTAILLVGATMVLAVGWGSFVSVRSAASGPAWAIGHLRRARLLATVVVVVGGAAVLAVVPVWAGLGVGYVALMVVFIAAAMQRNLQRVEAAGGFDDIDPDRRREIVARARTRLVQVGSLIAVAGVVMGLTGVGILSWIVGAIGAAMLVAAALLRTS